MVQGISMVMPTWVVGCRHVSSLPIMPSQGEAGQMVPPNSNFVVIKSANVGLKNVRGYGMNNVKRKCAYRINSANWRAVPADNGARSGSVFATLLGIARYRSRIKKPGFSPSVSLWLTAPSSEGAFGERRKIVICRNAESNRYAQKKIWRNHNERIDHCPAGGSGPGG